MAVTHLWVEQRAEEGRRGRGFWQAAFPASVEAAILNVSQSRIRVYLVPSGFGSSIRFVLLSHTFTKVPKVVSAAPGSAVCGSLFRCVKMQRDGEKEPEQLSRSWALLLAQLREDPRVFGAWICVCF